jgi:ribonuclease HI
MAANLDNNYRNRKICILSDNQVAIKARCNEWVTLKLVWDCHQSLMKVTKFKRVQLMWELSHEGTEGNEMADQLAKLGSECLFIGPELPRKGSGVD